MKGKILLISLTLSLIILLSGVVFAETCHSGATELCNGKDDDCNGILDDVDDDNDGVNDCFDDECLGTTYDTVVQLNPSHRAYDGRYPGSFTINRGSSTKPVYDLSFPIWYTRGCSCFQILDKQSGDDTEEYKYGCTQRTITSWVDQKSPGKITGAVITSRIAGTSSLGLGAIIAIIAAVVVAFVIYKNKK